MTSQTRMIKVNLHLKYTDTKMKEESRYSGRVVMYKIISRSKCTKIVTKPLFGKRHLATQNVYSCRKLERTTRLATWAAHAAVKYFHDEQSTNKTNKQFQTKNLRMSKAFQTTFHMALILQVFRIFKIIFLEYICCLSNLSCTASDATSPSDLPSKAVVQIDSGGSGRSWKTIARHALPELL